MDKLLAELMKEKKQKRLKLPKSRKWEHYIKLYNYKMIIMVYYEKLYANKLDDFVEMDKFLERFKLLKLTQKEKNT